MLLVSWEVLEKMLQYTLCEGLPLRILKGVVHP